MPLTLAGSGTITGADWGSSGAGLVKITTQSFSAASSVSINNCFTSTYDNYLILLSAVGSVAQDVNIRLRVAGVDASAANYAWTNADNTTTVNNTAQTSAILAINETSYSAARGEIFGPALAQQTVGVSSGRRPNTSTRFTSWNHTLATAYDGVTLLTSSGTMTGTVSIYGYTK